MLISWYFSRGRIGKFLAAFTENGLCAILPGDEEAALLKDLKRRFPDSSLQHTDDTDTKLQEVLDGERLSYDEPVDLIGSDFQVSVWAALSRIERGSVVTYSELAAMIGRPDAVRAVASACGANPISIIVPCHRVIRKDGSLGGYRWNLDLKRTLLEREGAQLKAQIS